MNEVADSECFEGVVGSPFDIEQADYTLTLSRDTCKKLGLEEDSGITMEFIHDKGVVDFYAWDASEGLLEETRKQVSLPDNSIMSLMRALSALKEYTKKFISRTR